LSKFYKLNEKIGAPEVKVIDQDGILIGTKRLYDAIRLAKENGLNLVEVNGTVSPPICKIIDLGKLKYEDKKRAVAKKTNQFIQETKEIELHAKTDDHDLNVKAEKARGFFEEGHKVRFIVKLKGRELDFIGLSRRNLAEFLEKFVDIATVDKPASIEGNLVAATLVPEKLLVQKAIELKKQRKEESRRLAEERAKARVERQNKHLVEKENVET
jgi:translation initiation factor IF-3